MSTKKTNRLASETSPYLLQHAHNPVDWYPWGTEALTRAQTENKPILLSIGYSACHWCHVMEHESFENEEIAALMNEHFVSIKVDREERPDLDQIYQNVAQLITRGGGWPLTVFLTPDLRPFFGGTYFPPEERYGRAGFPRVLRAIAEAFQNDPASVNENATRLTEGIRDLEKTEMPTENERPTPEGLTKIAETLLEYVDWENGGFGSAPKFPNTSNLSFLFRFGMATAPGGLSKKCLDAVTLALTKMASGGIYDRLGGGFHRYSVDGYWSVPHFEKMLYDNALLLQLYSEVLLTDGVLSAEERTLYREVTRETVGYVLREMRSPEGGFYSAQDADSEGEEGKFFAWSASEMASVLTPKEQEAACAAFGVTEAGNFEHGKTVLFRAQPTDLALIKSAKEKLFAARAKRTAPQRDDKILTSWNALMISGLAWASLALEDREIQAAASQAFAFLEEKLTSQTHRLKATYKDGQARFNAYLDDYANLAVAALDLARTATEAPERTRLISRARGWIDVILKQFYDTEGPGYFFTSQDHEALLQRPKTIFDQAIPSGTGSALLATLALAEIEADVKLESEADEQIHRLFPAVLKNPFGMGTLAQASLLQALGPVTVSGKIDSALAGIHAVSVTGSSVPEGTLICHRKTCSAPYKSTSDALAALSKMKMENQRDR